jgi:hypothetical protein
VHGHIGTALIAGIQKKQPNGHIQIRVIARQLAVTGAALLQLYHEPRAPAARLNVSAAPSHGDRLGANRGHYVFPVITAL